MCEQNIQDSIYRLITLLRVSNLLDRTRETVFSHLYEANIQFHPRAPGGTTHNGGRGMPFCAERAMVSRHSSTGSQQVGTAWTFRACTVMQYCMVLSD